MTTTPFALAGADEQVRRLTAVARRALPCWGMRDAELELLQHGYNTTFAVASTGLRFALRINVNAHKELPHLIAELAWLDALDRDTELTVPVPQPTSTGDFFTLVDSPDHDRQLPVVLYSWLEGVDLGHKPTRDQLRATGRMTAILHAHAAGWQIPPGADLPRIDTPLMNVPNRLAGGHPALPADGQVVLAEAMERIQHHYDAVLSRERVRPIHADLHGHNLRWFTDRHGVERLAVFDFDDAGLGVPVQDLAISAYYLRPDPGQEDRLLAGYAEVAPLPAYTTDEFEAIVASRNLVLANDMVATENAEFQKWAPRYLAATIARMRHFLDTGRYRIDAPGAELN